MANDILNYYTASFEADANGLVSFDKEAVINKITELGYKPDPKQPEWQTTFDGKTLFVVVPIKMVVKRQIVVV
jgi:hypothetical protein